MRRPRCSESSWWACWLLGAVLGLGSSSLAAQDMGSGGRFTSALGLHGFGAMVGVDFEDEAQMLGAVTLDFGHLLTERLRVRPSVEIGFLGGDNTYLANFELIYRVTDDQRLVVPYLGTGLGLRGRDACGSDPDCPTIWIQFVLGFDVRLRDRIGWTLEYHPADLFRRQRVLIGLTTRRGL
ncbi:MAG: hypothetical protein OER90_06340 [Gemmatimonadota bacterium]|nr:hypothetical protein [Gemmatimonadota bacterium]